MRIRKSRPGTDPRTPNRRHFLGSAAAVLGASRLPAFNSRAVDIARDLASHPGSPADTADDENFWAEVARAFTVDRTLVNLNNGGVSPSPSFVQDAMKRHLDYSNEAPTYTMWKILGPQREGVRARMAREWGVDTEEVAFTRNASEGLQTCQFGYDLEAGDEVLTTTQDYGRMLTTFRQRERREGIKMVQIRVPVPAEDPAEVVRRFEEAITPRTKLILMCHMINLTGQILPVREVVAMARRHDIPVIVDGAHAMAHFPFKLSDLDCDNYSTSLHKWLFAPHGTGLLYVRREKIPEIWPLMAAPDRMDEDIRKYEEIGTHPAANYLAIGEALTFHQGIGAERKAERLIYLRDYWANRLLENDRVSLNTSQKPGFACGIGNVHVDGLDTAALSNWLWDKHRIINVPIGHEECTGLRISPSVYTTLEEIDRFSEAMEWAITRGLPEA
ncbi:MAG: aminotransferase class V-fold PLP-dependent enzyme [Gemmatimonadetes bacterium]|nr:aminotransferase class V-fold PLP-dependent enzyme [Gemmatimonadota bacterium]MYB97444.1 aminotransferase class V-fold PLP-dependent enzyme [Gemmatimonadota bacterium]MYI45971.1 aminotransferase class V-fold PLP-dependent enzyme [Gemmatimonadota bacterium]